MRSIGLALALAASSATPALAQKPAPLPVVVFDVRGALAKLGTDAATAKDLGVATTRQPSVGLGVILGAHAYPFRRHGFAIGAGADWLLTRSLAQDVVPTGDLVGPAILKRSLSSISGAVSVNFGGRDGWSYISGGAGPLRFETTSSAIAHTTPAAPATRNVGGGARWFTTPHLAFAFDLRFYLTRPLATTATTAGRDRKRVLVFSVGIAIR
jgi:hypothetical protein